MVLHYLLAAMIPHEKSIVDRIEDSLCEISHLFLVFRQEIHYYHDFFVFRQFVMCLDLDNFELFKFLGYID